MQKTDSRILTPEQEAWSSNKRYRAKIKVYYIHDLTFQKCEIKNEASVWEKADALPVASEMIAQIIRRIADRDTELGFNPQLPIEHVKEIAWTTYNTAGTIMHNGRTVWLDPHRDPPVSIQTQLSLCVDEALRYHKQQIKETR